jgi:hypothetical protein
MSRIGLYLSVKRGSVDQTTSEKDIKLAFSACRAGFNALSRVHNTADSCCREFNQLTLALAHSVSDNTSPLEHQPNSTRKSVTYRNQACSIISLKQKLPRLGKHPYRRTEWGKFTGEGRYVLGSFAANDSKFPE